MTGTPGARPFDPFRIRRPDRSLLKYYVLTAILTGPAFPLIIIPLLIRYATLEYRFDDDGVFTSWGVLFHRQVYLTYRRIQDIHVTRNILHRWLGLAEVSLQTAAGSSRAEMTIEGILEPERLRDFLYSKMRGARGEVEPGAAPHGRGDEVLSLLREIRDGLRALRERSQGGGSGAPGPGAGR
jgi:uncharacterized protein